ncbi:MAG: hypothetical protein PHU85_05995 [Phycisphaerae bacterium]|nr:hypothetical protein [Phycisphaerae bacterium]
MPLFYKSDWDATADRYRAWWAHENIGRCGLWVTAPREKPLEDLAEPVRPPTPEQRWMDLDYIAALNRWSMSRTFYGGEAFPIWSGGYPGHTSHPCYMGCSVDLDFGTGWVNTHPALAGESLDCSTLKIDESCRYYQFQLQLLARGLAESKGRAIVATGAFGGVGDTLAWLRGSDRLLYDLIDRPDEVRRAELYLMEQWIELHSLYYGRLHEANGGSAGWYPLWAPGRFYATQNDFAYMISPAHFRTIFLSALERQLAYLDYAVHHVDGIGNFAHVDMLCEIPFAAPPGKPKLQALQILPGAGKPSPLHWMDVLKKVQRAGKNLHISIPANEVEAALAELSARGLFIATSCKTEGEARQLLRDAERWSKDRRF